VAGAKDSAEKNSMTGGVGVEGAGREMRAGKERSKKLMEGNNRSRAGG